MIDYSYVECTSACVTALKQFSNAISSYRKEEVANAIQEGGLFIKSIQRADGSWYGSWGTCFCYGILISIFFLVLVIILL
jgi:squalene cyclase